MSDDHEQILESRARIGPRRVSHAGARDRRRDTVGEQQLLAGYFVLVSWSRHLLGMQNLARVVERSTEQHVSPIEAHVECPNDPIAQQLSSLDDQLVMSHEPR